MNSTVQEQGDSGGVGEITFGDNAQKWTLLQ